MLTVMIDRIWIYLLFPGLPLLAMFWIFRRQKARCAHLRRPIFSFRRPAGYSLQEQVEQEGETLFLWIVAFMLSATLPAIVYTMGGLSIPSVGFCALPCLVFVPMILKKLPEYRNKRLGLIGEQIVGAQLDALQSNEISAYHDLVFTRDGRRWNIDHVLLTPHGLLVVETKARSMKRVKEKFSNRLIYDGKRMVYPNGDCDRGVIEQVLRNANDLRGDIAAWTGGESVAVEPVLVYTGWRVERSARGAVRVVSHDKLGQLLPLEGERIDKKTFAILKANLERESRVILDDESKPKEESNKANGHHWGAQAPGRIRAAGAASPTAESAAVS